VEEASRRELYPQLLKFHLTETTERNCLIVALGDCDLLGYMSPDLTQILLIDHLGWTDLHLLSIGILIVDLFAIATEYYAVIWLQIRVLLEQI
jgi:hypothetical protein